MKSLAVGRLPSTVIGQSPSEHGKLLPDGSAQFLPLLLLLVVAGGLAATGELTSERRDIHRPGLDPGRLLARPQRPQRTTGRAVNRLERQSAAGPSTLPHLVRGAAH